MELLESANEYLIVDGEECLRCSRITGQLEAASAIAIAEQSDPTCLGLVHGVLGRLEFTSNGPSYLILIKERKQIASHPLTHDPIYKIDKVIAIPLTTADSINYASAAGINGNYGNGIHSDLQLSPCQKHRNQSAKSGGGGGGGAGVVAGFSLLQKGQKKMAKATADSLKFMTNKMNVRGIGGGNNGRNGNSTTTNQQQQQTEADERERLRTERRLVAEFMRMFNEGDSFYYCPGADLTNNMQRLSTRNLNDGKTSDDEFGDSDERFVWNSYMLRDLIKQNESSSQKPSLARRWLVPIIQGFVGVENCSITLGGEEESAIRAQSPVPSGYVRQPEETFRFRLMLISRRSIHRAGTRYIKRGIDADGHVANYVETEQIVIVGDDGRHVVTYVQTRGSVPVYWSQPGFKYKPPPKLDRSKHENEAAFAKHFDEELGRYSNLTVVNLVEQNGKEKALSDAYMEHVLDLDSDRIRYVAFDFHEHCRGLRFENVALLTMAVEEQLMQTRFCWLDNREVNCEQTGVFRVNCVDCLDRTNVVQAALARSVLEMQLRKFGLLPPEVSLSPACLQSFQLLWACNGDAISRQYTGTAALKGDFTRTGQRNLAGMMKDGYNSANRYYLCHMKDARRQAAIDAFLGRRTFENDQELENLLKSKLEDGGVDDEASWLKEKDEQLRLFVRDCERLVVPDGEVILGGWAFIDADPGTGDETEEDMDTCVVLTRNAYYVAEYDEDLDKFVDFQRVALDDVQRIEAGPMTVASVLGVPKTKATCLRVTYKIDPNDNNAKEEYFHVWRSGSTRLFNNLAIAIKNPDEADEYMKAVAEQFRVALELISRRISVVHPPKLERKRSRLPPSKLAGRRNANVFGPPPVFISSLLTSSFGGGMKSFGNRVSAAFNPQNGQAMKFFRTSARRKGGATNRHAADSSSNTMVMAAGGSPLIKFDHPTTMGIDRRSTKTFIGPVVNKKAGLLFGIGIAAGILDSSESDSPLRRWRSEGEFEDKSKSDVVKIVEQQCDILIPDLYPFSPMSRPESAMSPRFEIASPTSGFDSISSTPRPAGPALLVPNDSSSSTHGIMKTSHSEISFKPQHVADSSSSQLVASTNQRALAVSQSALDKAGGDNRSVQSSIQQSGAIKIPLLFKRKPDETPGVGAVVEKRKFAQFQDRIGKSKTRFILL